MKEPLWEGSSVRVKQPGLPVKKSTDVVTNESPALCLLLIMLVTMPEEEYIFPVRHAYSERYFRSTSRGAKGFAKGWSSALAHFSKCSLGMIIPLGSLEDLVMALRRSTLLGGT